MQPRDVLEGWEDLKEALSLTRGGAVFFVVADDKGDARIKERLRGVGLTTAGDFTIIHFSHEALRLGSSAGDQRYHRLAVVSGRKAPVQDVLEILTSACGCLDVRRSAQNQARRALEAMGCG
jgi:hypothetical protein